MAVLETLSGRAPAPLSVRDAAGPQPPAGPPIAVSLGMAWWKRPAMGRALRALGHSDRFESDTARVVSEARRAGEAVGVWAAREAPDLAERADAAGVPVVRVEDGFLRSVGLGADFTPAASLILDRSGIYYDPFGPSDLETARESAPTAPAT